MPKGPLVACPRCHALHESGKCPTLAARRATYDQARGSASSRGYDAHWNIMRAAFLKGQPRCAEPGCGERATEVDHIDGNARNNSFRNLRPFCKSHHSARTARDQGFGAARRAAGGGGGVKSLAPRRP